MILASDAGDPHFFPIGFIQLSTRGEAQNMAPIATFKNVYDFETGLTTVVPFYRFYLDGLVIHFGMASESGAEDSLVVGKEASITFPTVRYEDSLQMRNLNYVKQDVNHEFPREFQKFF